MIWHIRLAIWKIRHTFWKKATFKGQVDPNSNLIFTACVACKIQVPNTIPKIKLIQIHFSNFIFQKSSTDQQGVCLVILISLEILLGENLRQEKLRSWADGVFEWIDWLLFADTNATKGFKIGY